MSIAWQAVANANDYPSADCAMCWCRLSPSSKRSRGGPPENANDAFPGAAAAASFSYPPRLSFSSCASPHLSCGASPLLSCAPPLPSCGASPPLSCAPFLSCACPLLVCASPHPSCAFPRCKPRRACDAVPRSDKATWFPRHSYSQLPKFDSGSTVIDVVGFRKPFCNLCISLESCSTHTS